VLSIGNDPTFKRFCDGFGLSHLLDDERFATNAARVQNRKLVTSECWIRTSPGSRTRG
jgi:crotonobetainyl-CoA:carnitine CoA-transferase CaiB-like acyl-CoA transferase